MILTIIIKTNPNLVTDPMQKPVGPSTEVMSGVTKGVQDRCTMSEMGMGIADNLGSREDMMLNDDRGVTTKGNKVDGQVVFSEKQKEDGEANANIISGGLLHETNVVFEFGGQGSKQVETILVEQVGKKNDVKEGGGM